MDIQQPTFDQDLSTIVSQLPPPIKAFFASGKVEVVAKNLMQKYRLHIDQGATTEREIILLLLGLKDPTEFTQTLIEEARLDQQTVNGIVQDVNAQIFVPLREELRRPAGSESRPQASGMRRGPNAEVKPPQAQSVAPSSAPREGVLQPRTTIIPANPNLPPRPAQTLASVPRYVPPKKYFNLQNKIPPPQNPPAPSLPASPELQRGEQPPASRLLEDHEEPHIEFHKTAPPPPNLPGAIYHPPIPKPSAPTVPVPPPTPQKPRPPIAPPPPAKPYSSDPYREPIEP